MATQNLTTRNSQTLFIAICFIFLLHTASAQRDVDNLTNFCYLPSDDDAGKKFNLTGWIWRGRCIRADHGHSCLDVLSRTLQDVTNLREAEYAGAASVLSLLPTIGALFGQPTTEIWQLKSIIPLGGALAMALSFGGALMPQSAADYDSIIAKNEIKIGQPNPGTAISMDEQLTHLRERVVARVRPKEAKSMPKKTLVGGLVGMFALWGMAQSGMSIVQQGAVVNYACSMRWWMHMWYFMVTLSAFVEDFTHQPFCKTYKLLVSSLPRGTKVIGGDSVVERFKGDKTSEDVIPSLSGLAPGRLEYGQDPSHKGINERVMVIVCVVGKSQHAWIWLRMSRVFSIAVFVTGTAFFASVILLSLIMAVVILTLTLAAGVFSRAIAAGIVARIGENEPVIRFGQDVRDVKKSRHDARRAIRELLAMKLEDGTPLQVEMRGQIFVDGKRIHERSQIPVAIFGVLASPCVVPEQHPTPKQASCFDVVTDATSIRSPLTTPSRRHRPWTLFHTTATDSTLLPLVDVGSTRFPAQESLGGVSSSAASVSSGFRIPRRPVPGAC